MAFRKTLFKNISLLLLLIVAAACSKSGSSSGGDSSTRTPAVSADVDFNFDGEYEGSCVVEIADSSGELVQSDSCEALINIDHDSEELTFALGGSLKIDFAGELFDSPLTFNPFDIEGSDLLAAATGADAGDIDANGFQLKDAGANMNFKKVGTGFEYQGSYYGEGGQKMTVSGVLLPRDLAGQDPGLDPVPAYSFNGEYEGTCSVRAMGLNSSSCDVLVNIYHDPAGGTFSFMGVLDVNMIFTNTSYPIASDPLNVVNGDLLHSDTFADLGDIDQNGFSTVQANGDNLRFQKSASGGFTFDGVYTDATYGKVTVQGTLRRIQE